MTFHNFTSNRMIVQKSRNKKNSSYNRSNSDPYNGQGGATLEPIYENAHSDEVSRRGSDPMREYMSQTILNHMRNEGSDSSDELLPESHFQIITDNASTHPELIATDKPKRHTPRKTKIADGNLMMRNRWEDSNTNSGSSSSCNRQRSSRSYKSASRSSSPPSERRWGSGEPPSSSKHRMNISNVSNSSIDTNSTSSLTVSLYDEDDQSFGSFAEMDMTPLEIIEEASDVVTGKYDYNTDNMPQYNRSGRRRQGRRSSMPTMPTRSTAFSNELPPIPPKLSSSYRSTSVPLPPSSIYGSTPIDSSLVVVDKFGIPTPIRNSNHNNTSKTMGRRRRERRSSMPSRAQPVTSDLPPMPKPSSFKSESSSIVLDKFGVPISSPQANSATRRRRSIRRSSLPMSPVSTSAVVESGPSTSLDKFGIPIRPTLSSEPSSDSDNTRKKTRDKSSPTRSVSFDLPPIPSSTKGSEQSSSIEGSVPVDKFGIPIWPKSMNPIGKIGKQRRHRQQRRSSMPTLPPSSTDSRPSPESRQTSRSNSFDKFDVIPNRQSRRRLRRSSLTNNIPTSGSTSTASDSRFLPEAVLIPGRNNSKTSDKANASKQEMVNSAPIRPKRVPSIDSFGSHAPGGKKEEGPRQNAAFVVVTTNSGMAATKKHPSIDAAVVASGNSSAPIRPQRVPSVDTLGNHDLSDGFNNNNKNLKEVLGRPNACWSEKAGMIRSPSAEYSITSASVNSMKQKDGEWWW